MKLEEITRKETELLHRMPKGGFCEERDEYLKKHDLYKEWQEIFTHYVEIATTGDIEAIKRALFFLWYQCSEPNQLSGINNLDEHLVEKVLLIVDKLAESHELDSELKWMLPYYYSVAEWYFARFQKLNGLLAASVTNKELWQTEKPKSTFINRGQLGEYWHSIGHNRVTGGL